MTAEDTEQEDKTMSETMHTPGPWRASRDRLSGNHGIVGDGMWFAKISWTVRDDRNEADARLIAAAPKLKEALAKMLDMWGGYECPEVDAAISVMQEIGEDVWSMQAQMDAAALVSEPSQS